jgi:hypothetical protein
MSTQYRLVQSGKTASSGCSAGQGSSDPVAPRIVYHLLSVGHLGPCEVVAEAVSLPTGAERVMDVLRKLNVVPVTLSGLESPGVRFSCFQDESDCEPPASASLVCSDASPAHLHLSSLNACSHWLQSHRLLLFLMELKDKHLPRWRIASDHLSLEYTLSETRSVSERSRTRKETLMHKTKLFPILPTFVLLFLGVVQAEKVNRCISPSTQTLIAGRPCFIVCQAGVAVPNFYKT